MIEEQKKAKAFIESVFEDAEKESPEPYVLSDYEFFHDIETTPPYLQTFHERLEKTQAIPFTHSCSTKIFNIIGELQENYYNIASDYYDHPFPSMTYRYNESFSVLDKLIRLFDSRNAMRQTFETMKMNGTVSLYYGKLGHTVLQHKIIVNHLIDRFIFAMAQRAAFHAPGPTPQHHTTKEDYQFTQRVASLAQETIDVLCELYEECYNIE